AARERCAAGSRVAKAVADAAYGEDVLGVRGVGLELLAQMPDVDVDRPRVAEVGAAPERLEQHPPAADATWQRGERAEQLELDEGQLDRLAVALDDATRHVDEEPVHLDPLLGRRLEQPRRLRATEQRAHAGAELSDRERLRDVVVGAELEPDHLVELVVAGGEHDDRHRARRAQPTAYLEPVEPRQHDVEDDEVDVPVAEAALRLLSVASLDISVPVALEREAENPTDGLFVVDEQDRG